MARDRAVARGRERMRDAQERLQREFLLEAAETCFAARGVEGTKMEEIAREAGLSLATIYELCDGKADLVRRVHEARLGELDERTRAGANAFERPFDRLMGGVREAVSFFVLRPGYLRMHLRDGHAWGVKEAYTTRPLAVADAWGRSIDWMIPVFEEGIRRGDFHADDPALMARRASAHTQVQMAAWLEDPDRTTPEATLSDLEEQMRRSFCRPTA